jgi:hypothetical protein
MIRPLPAERSSLCNIPTETLSGMYKARKMIRSLFWARIRMANRVNENQGKKFLGSSNLWVFPTIGEA